MQCSYHQLRKIQSAAVCPAQMRRCVLPHLQVSPALIHSSPMLDVQVVLMLDVQVIVCQQSYNIRALSSYGINNFFPCQMA